MQVEVPWLVVIEEALHEEMQSFIHLRVYDAAFDLPSGLVDFRFFPNSYLQRPNCRNGDICCLRGAAVARDQIARLGEYDEIWIRRLEGVVAMVSLKQRIEFRRAFQHVALAELTSVKVLKYVVGRHCRLVPADVSSLVPKGFVHPPNPIPLCEVSDVDMDDEGTLVL